MRGLEYEHQLEYTVDGARVHLRAMGGEDDFKANLVEHDEGRRRRRRARRASACRSRPARTSITRGVRRAQRRDQPAAAAAVHPQLERHAATRSGHPHFDTFTVTGPFNADGPGRHAEPPPDLHLPADADARRGRRLRAPIISTLARRAYRGEATTPISSACSSSTERARKPGTFETRHPEGAAAHPGEPEVRLPRRARSGRRGAGHGLPHQRSRARVAPVVLPLEQHSGRPAAATSRRRARCTRRRCSTQQVRRMLADPKAEALVDQLRGPVAVPAQPEEPAAELDRVPRLRRQPAQAFERETELFFAEHHARRPQRPRPDDGRLHVPQRAARASTTASRTSTAATSAASRSTDDARKGLLGKGAILMVTSHADRTSPVVRGKWVLDNLLSAPPPPMPNNVPPLNEEREARRQDPDDARADGRAPQEPGVRRLPQDHGSDRAVAGELRRGRRVAHARRRHARQPPIDASGELLDGTKVDGVVTLRQALLRQPEIFVGTVTEKLMTYALGRGLAYYDMPTVRAHRPRRRRAQDYRFSSIVLGIVNSTPFQKRSSCQDIENPAVRAAARQRVLGRHVDQRSSRPCSSPRCRCPGGRSCAAWAPRSRCRCSKRWCRR